MHLGLGGCHTINGPPQSVPLDKVREPWMVPGPAPGPYMHVDNVFSLLLRPIWDSWHVV